MKLKRFISIFLALAALSPAAYAKDAVYMEENSTTVIDTGKTHELSEPVKNIDGTVYVPVRSVLELLGYNVYWEDGKLVIGKQDEAVLSDMINDGYLAAKLDGAVSGDLSDIRKIKDALKESVYNKDADPTEALSLWKENGSFEGIEYYNPDRMVWTANNHVKYLLTMVQAAYSPENKYYGDKALKEKIAKSLDFWAHGGRVECDNWWQQEIGVPQTVVNILILNPDEITDDVRAVLNAEAAKGSIFNETTTDRMKERPVANTGANLADKLLTSFKIDIATENEAELWDAIHLMENEFRVFEKVRTDEYGEDSDGIKADYSFHQHVDQIQGGSYGEVMMNDFSAIISYLKGTKYKIADNALNEYANWLLDGQQWIFRNNYRELTTAGRHITRPNGIMGFRASMQKAVDALEGYTQIKRYDELMAMKQNRLGDSDTFNGNRHFWLSDYMSHNRTGYHVGLKLSSNRTKNGEVVNNENLLGYYLSDGVTTLMQDGDEYYNIMPLIDWNKLPGTTTPQGALKNLNDWADWNGEHLWNWKGSCHFVGGVSDGMYGAAVMDYSLDGLAAHKAWFMLDDRMIALGNQINAYSPYDIYTSINQCVKDGDIKIVSSSSVRDAKALESVKKGEAVLHNGIGYILKNDAKLSFEDKTAKYELINLGSAYKDIEESNTIFSLGIDHGKKPENASYEYTVLFNADEAKLKTELSASKISVIRNDDAMQAVYDYNNKIAEAIVWKAGDLELPSGLSVNINKKCALIIKELSDGTLEITASNPDNTPKDLQLVVNRVLPADGVSVVKESDTSTRIKFRLNEGVYSGSSSTYNSKTGFSEFLTNE
ncbi:MAG: polysaccharide lyase family 8 super-sandwich domain-containing protein [Clostridiales bacterium]|nr:polysaccharide lyase family 8 super-sandwich domain-containing protein [Clostridiales bacterium]